MYFPSVGEEPDVSKDIPEMKEGEFLSLCQVCTSDHDEPLSDL